MRISPTEFLRTQIDAPLMERRPWFAALSVLFLLPLSVVWSWAAAVRAQRRRKQALPEVGGPWIVSVGNVAVGGTGKSPIVRGLARMALAAGYDVVIMTRGVGRQQVEKVPVLELTSSRSELHQVHWQSFSDETLEHALGLRNDIPEGAAVWLSQGSRRKAVFETVLAARRTARAAIPHLEQTRPVVVLLDDGLQQTDLEVHRDVVVWDPKNVVAAPRFCLPFGPYRMGMPWSRPWVASLPRADVVVWSRLRGVPDRAQFLEAVEQAKRVLIQGRTRAGRPESQTAAESFGRQAFAQEWIAAEKKQLIRLSVQASVSGFEMEVVDAAALEKPFYILTGIGRPSRFVASLHDFFEHSSLPAPIVEGSLSLSDHGPLNSDARRVLQSGSNVVTTLKDACRWWPDDVFQESMRVGRVFVLALEVDFSSVTLQSLAADFKSIFSSYQVNN